MATYFQPNDLTILESYTQIFPTDHQGVLIRRFQGVVGTLGLRISTYIRQIYASYRVNPIPVLYTIVYYIIITY